jgi:chromosome partitioning protein
MKVLVISNHKGGCGKTTTAVNLAAYLAGRGRPTLLVDLDPSGGATLGCGIDTGGLARHIGDVFGGKAALADVVVPLDAIAGMAIAPSTPNLISAEANLIGQPGKEFVFKECLDDLTGFDYVIIDTPPNLGALTLNGLVAADMAIIPIQCEYYALEGANHLVELLDLLHKRFGRTPSIRVLLTMFDTRTNLAKEVVDEVQQHFSDNVFSVKIPRSVKLAEAPANGLSVFSYAPDSPGARAYASLGEEVLSL